MGHNNDNVIGSFKNNNDNNNGDRFAKSKRVESIAMKLTEKLHAPGSYKFYLKVAWALPESKIWLNYEKSRAGTTNPDGLFNWLCRKDMADAESK